MSPRGRGCWQSRDVPVRAIACELRECPRRFARRDEIHRVARARARAVVLRPPAQVAGVACLAAIGAASSLGAIVRATDPRPEVADQVKSIGGEYLPVEVAEQMQLEDFGRRAILALRQNLISKIHELEKDSLYERLLHICHFVSMLTDGNALLYNKIITANNNP